MAKRRHRHRRQPEGVIGPALRPIAWSAVFGAAIAAAATGGPAQAEPPQTTYAEPRLPDRVPDSVPDEGARPQPAGAVQLPGASTTAATPLIPLSPGTAGLGPLALQITAAETEVASLGEQLKQLAIEREQVRAEVTTLNAAWRGATAGLHAAEVAAENAAEEAYKRVAEAPPGTLRSDLHGLSALSRIEPEPDGSAAQASQLRRAREVEQAAYLAHEDALGRQRDIDTRYVGLQTTFNQREQALLDLRQRNASQLAAVEREREAQEQRLGASYLNGGSVAGLAANPVAMKAVRFALAQLGEPYLWGAEGPSRWDCSGLMWGAYRSADYYDLPRVSRDQFQATKTRQVSPSALLPGDLLFFSSSRIDASKIHHVGMYIGGGKMVHAPTTGDVVKISTVWWSRFFGATRVVGAVPAPVAPALPPVTPPSTGGGTTPPPPPAPPTTPPTKPPTKPPTGPTTPPPTDPTTPPPTDPTTPPPTDPTTPTPDPTTPAPEESEEPPATPPEDPPATQPEEPPAPSASPDGAESTAPAEPPAETSAGATQG
jgi:cell wall-associated NlpC family hydrolase